MKNELDLLNKLILENTKKLEKEAKKKERKHLTLIKEE